MDKVKIKTKSSSLTLQSLGITFKRLNFSQGQLLCFLNNIAIDLKADGKQKDLCQLAQSICHQIFSIKFIFIDI